MESLISWRETAETAPASQVPAMGTMGIGAERVEPCHKFWNWSQLPHGFNRLQPHIPAHKLWVNYQPSFIAHGGTYATCFLRRRKHRNHIYIIHRNNRFTPVSNSQCLDPSKWHECRWHRCSPGNLRPLRTRKGAPQLELFWMTVEVGKYLAKCIEMS